MLEAGGGKGGSRVIFPPSLRLGCIGGRGWGPPKCHVGPPDADLDPGREGVKPTRGDITSFA